MTKPKRKLKWGYKQEVASFISGEMEYVYKIATCDRNKYFASVCNHLTGHFEWLVPKPKTKRAAIAACERHARERRGK